MTQMINKILSRGVETIVTASLDRAYSYKRNNTV